MYASAEHVDDQEYSSVRNQNKGTFEVFILDPVRACCLVILQVPESLQNFWRHEPFFE